MRFSSPDLCQLSSIPVFGTFLSVLWFSLGLFRWSVSNVSMCHLEPWSRSAMFKRRLHNARQRLISSENESLGENKIIHPVLKWLQRLTMYWSVHIHFFAEDIEFTGKEIFCQTFLRHPLHTHTHWSLLCDLTDQVIAELQYEIEGEGGWGAGGGGGGGGILTMRDNVFICRVWFTGVLTGTDGLHA